MRKRKLKFKVGDIVRVYKIIGEDGCQVDKENIQGIYLALMNAKTKLVIENIKDYSIETEDDVYSDDNERYPYLVRRLDNIPLGENNRYCDKELKLVDEPISNWKNIIGDIK